MQGSRAGLGRAHSGIGGVRFVRCCCGRDARSSLAGKASADCGSVSLKGDREHVVAGEKGSSKDQHEGRHVVWRSNAPCHVHKIPYER